MFHPTTSHDPLKAKVKVGRQVPPSAVNLAYYKNENESGLEANSTFVSSTERKTSDSITGQRWLIAKDLPERSPGSFPPSLYYKDSEGYIGTVKRKEITWETRNRGDQKSVSVNRQYTLTKKDAPKSLPYNDGVYSGTLFLSSVRYSDGEKTHEETREVAPARKFFSVTRALTGLTSTSASFPESIEFSKDGFSGKLYKVEGKLNYFGKPNPSILTAYNETTGKVDGYFPSFLTKNGVTLYPTGEQEDRTVEKIVKHYGVCRYWGGGTTAPNNYYGNANYRFSVGGGIARGYFTDSIPRPTTSRYGHTLKEHDSESKYPVDTNGWYPPEKGIVWTYDIEEAMKYGGSSDPLRGGVVWASDYWTKSGQAWPPPGYENDYLIANGIEGHIPAEEIRAGGTTPVNHQLHRLVTRAGAQKTSTIGFYSPVTGWRNKWFRNTIHFYKGKTTEITSWAKYAGMAIADKGMTFTAYQDYEGYLEKKVVETETVVDEYIADCVYQGLVKRTEVVYDGRALYEGKVYKKTTLSSIEQEIVPNGLYFTGQDRKLYNEKTGEAFIESDNFSLTNIFKDGTPLHYVHKLKYPIYLPDGPKKEAILDIRQIKVLNSRLRVDKTQKYTTRLIPTAEENIYEVHLLCAEPTRHHAPCYVAYDKHGDSTGIEQETILKNKVRNTFSYLERISTEPLFVLGRDFTVTHNNTTRKNICTLKKSAIVSDSRAKVSFNYVVKSLDGRYRSRIIPATIVNVKYATESEKASFIGRKMIVSPLKNGIAQSALELIQEAYPGTSPDLLASLQYTVDLYDISSAARYKVNLYTEQNGTGPVSAETSEDTGFYDEASKRFIGTLPKEHHYKLSGRTIYELYHVRHFDQQEMGVLPPLETGVLERWFPRVRYVHFNALDRSNSTRIQASYTMPEYDAQQFASLGKPYVKIIGEKAAFIDEHHLQVRHKDLLVYTDTEKLIPSSVLSVTKVVGEDLTPLTVVGWASADGILRVKEKIAPYDEILVDYLYAENAYRYQGFTLNGDPIRLNINPGKYHEYTDYSEGAAIENQTYDLFNKTVYVFLKPTRVENLDTLEVFEDNPTETLYHKIDDAKPNGAYDLMVGKINLIPSATLKNTRLVDTRTLGGGLTEKMSDLQRREKEPESDYYWNIAHWNGEPFAKNGVVVIRLSSDLLTRFTQEEIEEKVRKHMALGTLPLIEYVTPTVFKDPAYQTSVASSSAVIAE